MKTLNILVCTDFSLLGNKAFKAAEALIDRLGGKITPFHAFLPPQHVEVAAEIYEPNLIRSLGVQDDYSDLEANLRNKLDETARRSVSEIYLNPAQTAFGHPASRILEAAKDYDMIIMSSHGRTGFSRLFLGSVAEKVLRLSKVPVMVVGENSDIKPLDRMLVTTDFSEASKAAFPWARGLAIAFEAEIDLVNVVSLEQTAAVGFYDRSYEENLTSKTQEKLQGLIDQHFSDIKDRVQSKPILSKQGAHCGLAELVESSDYNLVVMATVGYSGLEYLLLGSTTASLVRRVETAVLVVHP